MKYKGCEIRKSGVRENANWTDRSGYSYARHMPAYDIKINGKIVAGPSSNIILTSINEAKKYINDRLILQIPPFRTAFAIEAESEIIKELNNEK